MISMFAFQGAVTMRKDTGHSAAASEFDLSFPSQSHPSGVRSVSSSSSSPFRSFQTIFHKGQQLPRGLCMRRKMSLNSFDDQEGFYVLHEINYKSTVRFSLTS